MGVTLCVVFFKTLVKQSYSVTCSLKIFFSHFFPLSLSLLHGNFHICIQSNLSKIFRTANTACDVTVILSRFLFSSEVVSHIAFGDASHSHSWVYSLVSSERKGGEKKCDSIAASKSSNQTYISSAPYVGILSYSVLLNIMKAPERVHVLQNVLFSTECLQASTAEYSNNWNNTHFLTSGKFWATDKHKYFEISHLYVLLPQPNTPKYLLWEGLGDYCIYTCLPRGEAPRRGSNLLDVNVASLKAN